MSVCYDEKYIKKSLKSSFDIKGKSSKISDYDWLQRNGYDSIIIIDPNPVTSEECRLWSTIHEIDSDNMFVYPPYWIMVKNNSDKHIETAMIVRGDNSYVNIKNTISL